MMPLFDEMREKTESAQKDFLDEVYDELVTIRNRCRLEQYSKRDLEAEITELLERMY